MQHHLEIQIVNCTFFFFENIVHVKMIRKKVIWKTRIYIYTRSLPESQRGFASRVHISIPELREDDDPKNTTFDTRFLLALR